MKPNAKCALLLLLAVSGPVLAQAQISRFQHVVVIFQENRTPDNLFQGLCGTNRTLCPVPYDLQDFGLDKEGKKVPLAKQPLGSSFNPDHSHRGFVEQCNLDPRTNQCRMDGLDGSGCPNNCSFQYVDPNDVSPYITMAQQYGWANFMFQTNQGPSFPAHQFIFGGTSAPDANSDRQGIFAAENTNGGTGCAAPPTAKVAVIRRPGIGRKGDTIFPCFEHNTIPDILPPNVTWRYYAPDGGSIWTAPNAIAHICGASRGACKGSEWVRNVDLNPNDVLNDIASCNLQGVSWVIPSRENSDHAGGANSGGPSWVASIVNAIGNSTRCDSGAGYWHDTAILLAWDDWGGFYDHEPPMILPLPVGDYQYGFRVPLVVISAYTTPAYVDNRPYDFGSVLRFVEHNFEIREGELTFADQRATNDLTSFFNLNRTPRPFVPIRAPKDVQYFLNDNTPPTGPDDD